MAFGKQMGSLKTLKKSLAKGGGGGQWVRYIPKNGALNVRFATEPEEWVNYDEHYDQMRRKSYPCNGLSTCEGCSNNERKTSRYLANAIDLEGDNGAGRMIPLQMPKDLANRIVAKYEKWGTITDRDIELTRTGEGLDTIYDLDADSPSRRKMDKFTQHDLEKVLQDAWDEVFGADEDDDEEEEAPKAKPRARKASAASRALHEDAVDEDDDDEDEAPPAKPARKAAAKKAKAKKKAPEPEFVEEDDDEDEEVVEAEPVEDEDDEDEGEEVEYTIEELESMGLGQLRRVARDEFGVDPAGKNKKQIIALIEDAPPF